MTRSAQNSSGADPSMSLAQQLRSIAEGLARQAGDMALAGRKSEEIAATTKSSPTDMVTQFDQASEQLITTGLRALRPDDGVIGEEGSDHTGTTGLTWHIDPIDGTSNFFFDIPMWAVSIGVADEHGPLAGAVYAPALGEMFSAARGHGATVNGLPIGVRRNSHVSDAMLCTGFSYRVHERPANAARVARMITQVRDIRRFGAAAIDLCFVACGRLDAYFEEHLHSWDLVAGQIIATEAGAIVTDYSGGPVRPAQVLASQPEIHAAVVALINDSSQSNDTAENS